MEMKNNEWNVPSDYFEKNKKALMPVRNFPTTKWILALAAACVIGVGLFMLKGENQVQEVAKVEELKNEKQNERENEGKKGEEKVREDKKGEDIGSKHLSTKEDIAEELKEIPRDELVAYLLEEDSNFIENID
jgi:hypothetical protein